MLYIYMYRTFILGIHFIYNQREGEWMYPPRVRMEFIPKAEKFRFNHLTSWDLIQYKYHILSHLAAEKIGGVSEKNTGIAD